MSLEGTVYVIDDDAAMRESLEFLLDLAGFTVTLFSDASVFLEQMPGLSFGCVVSDIRMPGINGIDLLRSLKMKRSELPIIIMTGHGDIPLAVEAIKLGALDFLEKPFEDERLIGAIRTAFKQGEDSAKNKGAAIDLAARIASLSQRERRDGRSGRRALQQADRPRLCDQPADHRGLPGQCHDENAGAQPVRAGPAGGAGRRARGLRQINGRLAISVMFADHICSCSGIIFNEHPETDHPGP